MALAGGVSAITISPPIMEVVINPAETQEEVVTLYNEGSQDLMITGYAEAFTPRGENGEANIIQNSAYQALPWISLKTNNFILASGQIKQIPITIAIPRTAAAGGYYVAIMFESKMAAVKSLAGEAGTAIIGRVGSLALIKVSGESKEKMEVLEFNVNQNISPGLPIDFTTRLKNAGDVHLKPTGYITIVNMFGRVVTTIPINYDGRNVLPSSIRKFVGTWDREMVKPASASSFGVAKGFINWITVKYHNFAMGKYIAQLQVEYGDSHARISSRKVGFWVIPWRALLMIIVIIMVGWFIKVKIHKLTKG